MWTWLRVGSGTGGTRPVGAQSVMPVVRTGDSPLTKRELHLLDAAEVAVSSWEVCRDDVRHDVHSLRHEDALVCALERLDGALDPYHLPTDGGE